MTTSSFCPCCSGTLIHHISHHRDYWFCRTCWQEMPLIDMKSDASDRLDRKPETSKSLTYIPQLS